MRAFVHSDDDVPEQPPAVRLSGGGEALVELASGIDAFYLSGRGPLPHRLLERLEAARAVAAETGSAQSFRMGGDEWLLRPYGLLKYRYRLDHDDAVVGLTASEHLPPVRVQPRSEALHSIGPDGVLRWVRTAFEFEGASIDFRVGRIDVYADFQGWVPAADDHGRFVCRARELTMYHDGAGVSGFTFGTRKSGSMTARIYDKTREIAMNGHDWWFEMWGDRFNPELPVIRIEFEFSRQSLREMGLDEPYHVLLNAGELWAYGTQKWLTYREPSDHHDPSRWPLAQHWATIQQASLLAGSLPRTRIEAARSKGALRLLMPLLNGAVASYAVLMGRDSIADACRLLPGSLARYELTSGRTFADRIAEKIAAQK